MGKELVSYKGFYRGLGVFRELCQRQKLHLNFSLTDIPLAYMAITF
jgi:hypothetical protein